jgi:hypothetical protein
MITLYARPQIVVTPIDYYFQNGGMCISDTVSVEMAAITWYRNYCHHATLPSANMEDEYSLMLP